MSYEHARPLTRWSERVHYEREAPKISFGWTAATWAIIASTATTAAVGIKQADTARRTGNQANDQARAAAARTAQEAERAANKANAKAPDTAALMAANLLAGKLGQGGTLLTGPTGVDPAQLTLGKTKLLGS